MVNKPIILASAIALVALAILIINPSSYLNPPLLYSGPNPGPYVPIKEQVAGGIFVCDISEYSASWNLTKPCLATVSIESVGNVTINVTTFYLTKDLSSGEFSMWIDGLFGSRGEEGAGFRSPPDGPVRMFPGTNVLNVSGNTVITWNLGMSGDCLLQLVDNNTISYTPGTHCTYPTLIIVGNRLYIVLTGGANPDMIIALNNALVQDVLMRINGTRSP
jgi:hypothetical protein